MLQVHDSNGFLKIGGVQSIQDDRFNITGSTDVTKRVRFEVDGLTTSTTRTITPPDADIEIQGTHDVQSSNWQARNHGLYTAIASATVTDPGTPAAGHEFTTLVRNGTLTTSRGTYSVAGTLVQSVWHSGSWVDYPYGPLNAANTWTVAQLFSTASSAHIFRTTLATNGNTALAIQNDRGVNTHSLQLTVPGSTFAGYGILAADNAAIYSLRPIKIIADGPSNTVTIGTGTSGGTARLTITDTGSIFGTDPGSSELLRVGGSAVAGSGIAALGSMSAPSGTHCRIEAGAGISYITAATGGTLQTLNARCSAFVIGTDPGGSELLRVGGAARINGVLTASSSDHTVNGLVLSGTATLFSNVSDGYLNSFAIAPAYNGAFTVTRVNYMNFPNVTGTATITDACLMRLDAAPGTHKAVDAGTTKTTPGTVNAWIKVNINGTVYYLPSYTSKTT